MGALWWISVAVFAGAWLLSFVVCVVVGKCLRARREQLEEDEVRLIASNCDLPANWRELDSHGSWLDALAEIRRREAASHD